MSATKQKKFAEGIIAKRGSEKAHWVLAKLSLKREEVIKWLQGMEGDWVNLEVAKSEKAKYGASIYLDDYKPDSNYQRSEKEDREFDRQFDQQLEKEKAEELDIPPMPDYDLADVEYKDVDNIPF